MSNLIIEVRYYLEDGTESPLSPLSGVTNISMKQSIEGKNYTSEVRLRNPLTTNSAGNYYHEYVDSGTGNVVFQEGQSLKIFAAYIDTNRVELNRIENQIKGLCNIIKERHNER